MVPLARKLVSVNEIDTLTTINGLCMEEIERRAQPLQDKTLDPVYWRCRSWNGFLDSNQNFKECLSQDWKCVLKLGTTHICLATHLKNILTQVEEIKRKTKRGTDFTVEITYFANDLPSSKEQTLRVGHRWYVGEQWSLFYNENSEEERQKWKEDYYIWNDDLGLSITLGGGLSGGTIFYIENYGFYEGGTDNEYRIEPDILVAMLSGKMTSGVARKQIQNYERKIEKCHLELNQLQQSRKTELDKINVQSSEAHMKKKLEDIFITVWEEKQKEIQLLDKEKLKWTQTCHFLEDK